MDSIMRLASICALAALSMGCSAESVGDATPSPNLQIREYGGIAFITQNVVQTVHMDALFRGTVVSDQQGCLRLDDAGAATVVWPQGFTAAIEDGALVVRDRDGAEVGRVGGAFSLGGGEVPALSDGMGFTVQDRLVAEARCPGLYWIVAG